MFGYLLESPHSHKYPKYMFYEEVRTKQDLSYISIWAQLFKLTTSLVNDSLKFTSSDTQIF